MVYITTIVNATTVLEHEADEAEHHVLSEEFAVHLMEDSDPFVIAKEMDIEYKGTIGSLKCYHLFRAKNSSHAEHVYIFLSSHSSVRWFEQQKLRWRHRRVHNEQYQLQEEESSTSQATEISTKFTRGSNDTSMLIPKDPLFPKQWHLLYNNQFPGSSHGVDINVVPAWALANGSGVCIAIVDDGILHQHEDLKDRYIAENSYNFNDDNNDLSPKKPDTHGTMCAGAAVASANSKCGVGVAFNASVSALRILGGPSHDAMEAHALTYRYHENHIFSNSWGPTDDGKTVEGPGPLTLAALADGAHNGRGGLGVIYVWASGNGYKFGDSCNYDGYASSRYVLTVSSVDYLGRHPFYSESCAAIIVAAPSFGKDSRGGVVTTNVKGDCTQEFTGTSAAAPLVAGVASLLLQVNPSLTWRDVHHIFVTTSRRNDEDDLDWILNGANLWVNHKYGFGIVDAHRAVNAAIGWKGVGEEIKLESPVLEVNAPIKDGDPLNGITSCTEILENIALEHIEIVFTATHGYRSDLRVVLYSPAGTPSYLSELHGTSQGYVFALHNGTNIKVEKASFGPLPVAWIPQRVEAPLVLAEPLSACSPLANVEVTNGSIVIVRPSTDSNCDWSLRAKHAQQAGAAAMIAISDKEKAYEMGGYDPTVAIPSLMISPQDGSAILAEIDKTSAEKVLGQVATKIAKAASKGGFDNWVFSSVHSWGESSQGNWCINVYDMNAGGAGVFVRWQLKLYGARPLNTSRGNPLAEEDVEQKYATTLSDSPPLEETTSSPGISFSIAPVNLAITIVIVIALTMLAGFGWYFVSERRLRKLQDPIVQNL